MQILRAADRIATPWKNGGGVTREIAAWPPGANLETFDWRISMATVERGGPFSLFAGVDRILTVLEGELILSIDGAAPVTLDPGAPPLPFPGDVPVFAQTPRQPVTDLNVMARRGRVRASVNRVRPQTKARIGGSAWTVIFNPSDDVDIRIDGVRRSLGQGDAALVAGAAAMTVEGPVAASVLAIGLTLA